MPAHRDLIVEQFTKQAVPFSTAPGVRDEEALRLLVDFTGAGPEDTVLDVACGPGLVVCALAAVVRHATGIDVTPAMIERARALAAEKGLANVAWRVGDVLRWMFFEQYSHEPYIAVARAWLHVFTGKQVDADRLREKMEGGYRALDVMERHLAARRFFVDERYTIADIALYAYTHVAHEGDFHLERYPNVRTWLARVASQPGHVPITQREFD